MVSRLFRGELNQSTKCASGDFSYLPTTAKRIERVIAEDEAWLAAYPTKRSVRATKKSDQS
jgi:hypothetical protein